MTTASLLNLIFNGLSTAGTVGAVIVSLCLATRSNKPKLKVAAKKATLEISGKKKPALLLTATNTGTLPIKVIDFRWIWPWLKSNSEIYPEDPYYQNYNTKLPRILYPGEEAQYFWCYNTWLTGRKSNTKESDQVSNTWLARRHCKIGADASSGQTFWGKIDRKIIDDVLNPEINSNT